MANNPAGANGTEGQFTQEAPYGSQRKLETLTSMSPLATAPGVNAPRQAQRHAINGGAAQQQQISMPVPATPDPQIAYPVQLARVWQQIAAQPGADDLVKQIAAQAMREASLG